MSRAFVALGCLLGSVSCGSDRAATSPLPVGADGGSPSERSIPSVLNGTELASGHIDIVGITTDGNVVGLDQERGAIVVPPSGGALTVVDAAADYVTVRGQAVLAFHNSDFVTGIADLTVWTAASGVVPFTTGATFNAAASDDGTRLLATEASSSDGTTTDLVVGGTNGLDGGAPIVLRTVTRKTGCTPSLRFVDPLFVLSYCGPNTTSRTLATVDPVSGSWADILTDVGSFSVLPSSSASPARLLVTDSSDGLALLSLSGGAPTPLAADAQGYLVLPDYSGVMVRSDSDVRRVPFDGSPSTVLVSSRIASLRGISPDGQSLLYCAELGSRFGDLWLTSAAAPSSPRLLSAALDATVFGSAFTADSSQALYFTRASDLFVGTLSSEPVSGGAATERGRNVWTVVGYADSRVVYNDQYAPVPKRPGRATIRTVDTAGSADPAIIATHAGSTFVLNDAKDHVFFSFDDGTDAAGVYVAPLP